MHLVSLNPYIQGVIQSADKDAGGAGAGLRMPRQGGAQVSAGRAGGGAGGTSGFAFQGTNGHAVLQTLTAGARGVSGVRSSLAVTDRQRFWLSPETHALLKSVRASPPGRCMAQAELSARYGLMNCAHHVIECISNPGWLR